MTKYHIVNKHGGAKTVLEADNVEDAITEWVFIHRNKTFNRLPFYELKAKEWQSPDPFINYTVQVRKPDISALYADGTLRPRDRDSIAKRKLEKKKASRPINAKGKPIQSWQRQQNRIAKLGDQLGLTDPAHQFRLYNLIVYGKDESTKGANDDQFSCTE